MPIYAYRCATCGHAQDVLQKISDPLLTTCPACGASTFSKQVTAAGFQLKGSGWYVTDFRGGNTAGAPPVKKDEGGGDSAPSSTPAADAQPAAKPADKPADKPAATPAAPPPAAGGSSSAA